jgi:hypothetical protein
MVVQFTISPSPAHARNVTHVGTGADPETCANTLQATTTPRHPLVVFLLRLALLLALFLLIAVAHVTAAGRGARKEEAARADMISQFFVLSQRGDHIVFRDCKIWIPHPSNLGGAENFSLFDVT